MENCNTAEQTSKILLDAHFPGSTQLGNIPLPTSSQVGMDESSPVRDEVTHQTTCPEQVAQGEVQNHQYDTVLDRYLDDLSFLSPDWVKEAFKNMNPYNAGGPDKMKSIIFQNVPHNILIRISELYQACVKLSYTPSKWCESDVIFLPKPEKPRYDIPNSFRPIFKFNVALIEQIKCSIKAALGLNSTEQE